MLKDKIDALIQSAMLEKNNDRVDTLRLMKSQMLVAEKSGEEYTEQVEMKLLLKMKASIEDSVNIPFFV